MSLLLENVVMQVESGGFTGAIRFEAQAYRTQPTDGPTIKRIADANKCNLDTAHAIYWTSYGLFQFLGATLYGDLAYPTPLASFWIDSEQQITQFRKLVTMWGFDPMGFDFTDDALLAKFAARYNGPGNVPSYVQAMKTAYNQLKGNP